MSSTKIRNTFNASFPKLKNEKKYWGEVSNAADDIPGEISHLVNRISLIIVDDSNLARVREINNLTVFNVDDILDWQRNLDAVTLVMRAEDDLL